MSTLKAKVDKASQSHDIFAINPSKFEKPHKKYNLIKKDSNGKSESHHRLLCHYCCKKDHTIENENLGAS